LHSQIKPLKNPVISEMHLQVDSYSFDFTPVYRQHSTSMNYVVHSDSEKIWPESS